MKKILLPLLFSLLVLPFSQAEEKYDPLRWESTIEKFREMDAKEFPPKGATLFIGSSSIRLWDLKESFPDLVAVNRGFGGSHIEDSIHYASEIVLPYEPKTIVLYAGDNDVAHGYSTERVSADFDKFVALVHKKLPKTKIIFVAIKPSLKRWSLIESVRAANSLVKKTCDQNDKLVYLDIDTPMLGKDGKPQEKWFLKDGLHLNKEGYALWNKILKPHLD